MAERILFVAEKLKLSIGRQVIFDQASLSIYEGERIALVGRNGCGKSTLLRVIMEEELPSDGTLAPMRNLRVAMLPQDFEPDATLTIRETVRQGLEYFEALHLRYNDPKTPAQEHVEIEHTLTRHNAWNLEIKLDEILAKLELNHLDHSITSLSGGEKRRVALARAIVGSPDLLLLDEPTNHLDVTTIEWIEDFLASYRGSCLFVTHDRYFLDRLATRTLELDNGKIYSYNGSYADFLVAKAARETAEDLADSKRKKFLRSEIDWVRRSPKARLRRNMGRIKNFEAISAIAAPIRTGDIELVIPPAPRLGNQTVILKEVTHAYPNAPTLFSNFSFEFAPGSKIGIVGPNGIGKSSLLQIITGSLIPSTGEVKVASTVEFNYIDQSRLALDPEKTVAEEIGEGRESIELGSEKISIWGYLKRFLFEDERINTQIKFLSGGEKARITMAKILKQGGNFLILDEPTNDLDLSSLRLLEEALFEFNGCVIVVSHDRYFLNRVCDGILSFERGQLYYTPGDYDYYLTKRQERQAKKIVSSIPKAEIKVAALPLKSPAKKLSYKENLELNSIEGVIAEKEEQASEIENIFAQADFFATRGHESNQLQKELEELRVEIENLYARWDELEQKKTELS